MAAGGEQFDVGPGAPNATERIENVLLSYGTDTGYHANPLELGLDDHLNGFMLVTPGYFVCMAADQEHPETPSARRTTSDTVDERFRSLMEGLRTTLPGAQVLVAFLLVLPVQAEFAALSDLELRVYYTAFASAMLASVLLIAPSAHQRMRSPISGLVRRTERHLDVAVRLTITGTVLLLISLTSVCYLVTSLVTSGWVGAVSAAVLVTVGGYTWFYQPLIAFGRGGD